MDRGEACGRIAARSGSWLGSLPDGSWRIPIRACSRGEALANESFDGEWSGAADNEACEAGQIEQNDFITHWPEPRSSWGHGEELN